MAKIEQLVGEQAYIQIFDVLGHEAAYPFYLGVYPEKMFPVHEHGWGFRLIEDLEYSVSESRAKTLSHHFQTDRSWEIVAMDRRSSGLIILEHPLSEEMLKELSGHVSDIKSEMQQWAGIRLF